MGYRNVSLPKEFVDEIENKKPAWMSIAEYVRHAVYYYMREYKETTEPILEEITQIE